MTQKATPGTVAAAEWVAIDTLAPWDKNPRRNDEAAKEVAKSIQRFGFGAPILARSADRVVIAGHTRLKAAALLGLDKVPVRFLDLDPAEARALALADNKLGELAEWDEAILGDVLRELEADGAVLDGLGFSEEELRALMADPEVEPSDSDDDAPEVDEHGEPDSVLGGVYELGPHRLVCGDCRDLGLVSTLMQGEQCDMVWTDPPYGMFLDTNFDAMFAADPRHRATGERFGKVAGDHEDFTPDLISSIFTSFGYCAEMFIWGADYFSELIPDRNKGSWIAWDKRCDDNMDKVAGNGFELCWSKAKHKRSVARILWSGHHGMQGADSGKRQHPTQKPVTLALWFFERWGASRDVVVDVYAGSGTTLIAAAQTGRIARLIELDPKFCDVIRRRWTRWAREHGRDPGPGALDG